MRMLTERKYTDYQLPEQVASFDMNLIALCLRIWMHWQNELFTPDEVIRMTPNSPELRIAHLMGFAGEKMRYESFPLSEETLAAFEKNGMRRPNADFFRLMLFQNIRDFEMYEVLGYVEEDFSTYLRAEVKALREARLPEVCILILLVMCKNTMARDKMYSRALKQLLKEMKYDQVLFDYFDQYFAPPVVHPESLEAKYGDPYLYEKTITGNKNIDHFVWYLANVVGMACWAQQDFDER